MKETSGMYYPDGSFRSRTDIDLELQMKDRGFTTARPQMSQAPRLEQFIQRQEQVKPPSPDLKYYFPNEPTINFMSDLHLGGDCDYKRVQNELNAIMDKKDSFVIFVGDLIDNFSFNPAQHEDQDSVPRQIQLAQEVITKLTQANRLLAIVDGNHEFWSQRAGINLMEILTNGRVPVVAGVNYFTFNVAGTEYKATIAHSLPGSSTYNNVHPQLREGNFGAEGADLIIGGHTHRRGFTQQSKKEHGGTSRQVTYLSLGTYKYSDGYGRNKGFHDQTDNEMGGYAVKLHKGKRIVVSNILEANQR